MYALPYYYVADNKWAESAAVLTLTRDYWLNKKGTWAVEGEDTNVHNLQTHVSHLLSHVSEHVPIWIGLVGPGHLPRVCPSTPSIAQIWSQHTFYIHMLKGRERDPPFILISRTGPVGHLSFIPSCLLAQRPFKYFVSWCQLLFWDILLSY
jgi:hypothetical protein